MSTLDFDAFFTACHGKPPLPWQSRLAQQLCSTHVWPDLIDLPTASGKTACMDIALFHLAVCAAQGIVSKAARRIAFVVDRRIIVDAAAERAEKLVQCLSSPDALAPIKAVADALRLCGGALPLTSHKLRGGMPKERGFATCPAQPMIISSTVDQIGSRLLFRGYGVREYSSSLHAGLLGFDTLILLDEAHLSGAFSATVGAIRREQSRAKLPLPLQNTRIVPLSATAISAGNRFQLDAEDYANPLIQARQNAVKPAQLIPCEKAKERAKILVQTARAMLEQLRLATPKPALAVVVNRVQTARAVFDALREALKDSVQLELMIGRARPIARDIISARLMARCAAGREPNNDTKPVIVVATQTIEVGADLDFQGLISECAALDSLRQRFGRLDRLGLFKGARAAIIGGGDAPDDPVYGGALSATWDWLGRVADKNIVDFGIAAMRTTLEHEDIAPLIAPTREQLQLTPTFMELLCQTSPRPQYDPDVAALLHGFSDAQPDVNLLWRKHLPLKENGEPDATETALVNTIMTALRPSSLETLTISARALKAWLSEQEGADAAQDLEGVELPDLEQKRAKFLVERPVWRRTGNSWEIIKPKSIRPDDTILVPCEYGGCDAYGWAPDSIEATDDLSAAALESQKAQRQKTTLMMRSELAAIEGAAEVLAEFEQEEITERRTISDLKTLLKTSYEAKLTGVELLRTSKNKFYGLMLQFDTPKSDDLSEEDDSSNRVPGRVLLRAHNAGVSQHAEKLASKAGLAKVLIADLALAGSLHDIGKADPRFQRMLRGNAPESVHQGLLLAKGLMGKVKVSLGARHEAYSVGALETHPQLLQAAHDPELVKFLIGSHHGRGRGLMPDVNDPGCQFPVQAADTTELRYSGAPNLGALSSGWPDLFWALNLRYGAHGLAYLEAILRLADHQQSAIDSKNPPPLNEEESL